MITMMMIKMLTMTTMILMMMTSNGEDIFNSPAIFLSSDLYSAFFDLESEMERSRCRDVFCTDESLQKSYWKELIDVLLFLLMDPKDFHNKVPGFAFSYAFLPFYTHDAPEIFTHVNISLFHCRK